MSETFLHPPVSQRECGSAVFIIVFYCTLASQPKRFMSAIAQLEGISAFLSSFKVLDE